MVDPSFQSPCVKQKCKGKEGKYHLQSTEWFYLWGWFDGDVRMCIDSILEHKRKHSQPDVLVHCLGVQTQELRRGNLTSLEFKNEFVSDFARVFGTSIIHGADLGYQQFVCWSNYINLKGETEKKKIIPKARAFLSALGPSVTQRQYVPNR